MADYLNILLKEDLSSGDFLNSRRIVTGLLINEPPPYKGCTGFYGWEDVCLLKSGEMLCSFSGGYWHASYPTPTDLQQDFVDRECDPTKSVDAPTGGRALLTRSMDFGKTWCQPKTLYDTPYDDRHPTILELPDGSLLCAMFLLADWYGYEAPPKGKEKNSRVCTMKSYDCGNTWSEIAIVPSPFKYYDRMRSKLVLLKNGEILLPTYSCDKYNEKTVLGLYVSDNNGESFRYLSTLKSEQYGIDEPAICQAKDDSLVLASRPGGEFSFSYDNGKSWTMPESLNIPMVAPCLITLKNGTILCLFGRIANIHHEYNSIQLIWSHDNGHTWIAPMKDNGFIIDDSAYLYANCCELPDKSIYIVYYHPVTLKQNKTAVMSIRIRIHDDDTGIDILPIADDDTSKPVFIKSDLHQKDKLDVDAK